MFSSFLRAPLTALVTYVAAVSAIPAISSAPSLTVKTSIADLNFDGLKSLEVTATIVNTGEKTIQLLNDPRGVLDPFPEDSFTIIDPSGSRLPFIGARANYNFTHASGLDGPNAFTALDPGDSINVTHNLSPAYDFAHSGAGDYSIKPSNLFAYVDSDGTAKDLYATVVGIARIKLPGGFAVPPRIHDKRGNFFGCRKKDRARVRAAGNVAHTLIVLAYEYIQHVRWPGTRRYETWFGPYHRSRHLVVERSLGLMSSPDQFTRLDYHCLEHCNDPRNHSIYVLRGNTRDVFICPSYFTALPIFRYHSLIHEVSHFYGSEDDDHYGYGYSAATRVAIENPDLAVTLAENYAFFVDNIANLP